ncbi:MAG: transcription-repair coupling factor, partial [Bdellovibrionales bacterium]|nr:transcription-repair coupling factor [Bdellovibrionales bacterium]
VLTLTATPIPRTLHMSLLGIRDLSVIETPPNDRQAIRTYISPYSDAVVREAVMRELSRGGQVFYIHNRVQTIAAVVDELREIVPEARIDFGHGQMKDKQLEEIMHRFVKHEIDVLVSTTIVESGLDIPNANTIIIRKADHFGLAELYQLRGRVGRSSRRAYAYFLVSDPKTMGESARKRLQVLQSLDDLGMGFRLALQDMEIRGAGNLLGKDQSGDVNAVGFEMYSRILRETVQSIRDSQETDGASERWEDIDPDVNIGFPAHIPPTYIPDVEERLLLYQRLSELRNDDRAMELADEIEDRFGAMPEEVSILIESMMFRGLLRRAGIVSARFRDDVLTIHFDPRQEIQPQRVLRVVHEANGRIRILPNNALRITLESGFVSRPADLRKSLEVIVRALGVPL